MAARLPGARAAETAADRPSSFTEGAWLPALSGHGRHSHQHAFQHPIQKKPAVR